MSLMTYIFWLILLGNELFAQGFQMDLYTGIFVHPDGRQVIITNLRKPNR